MSNRIGPRMRDVASYVAQHDGCAMIEAARFVGPNGSLKFGYRTVHRAIAAGLVSRTKGTGNSYTLSAVRP